MKLTTVLLIVTCLQVSAKTYSQKVTLKGNNIPLQKVFEEIRKQTGYQFLYADEVMLTAKNVNLDIYKRSIKEGLDLSFQNQQLAYTISEKTIIVKRKAIIPEVIAPPPAPVPIQITGKITDDKGQPLAGATILVKGNNRGTKTDALGLFSIDVPPNSTLLISYVGFETAEIKISSQLNINIQLKPSVATGEQVVVVGYGTQKKQTVVGAIAQVTNEQLKRAGGVTDLSQALTGQLPGLVTINSNGEPGGTGSGGVSGTTIFIRGQNTWNGGQPFILVDGVERAMNNVDVSEVENISILKDASATAVFGVKGANGVILITTKRGTTGKPRLSFTYSTTALMVSKLPQKMDSYDAIMIRNEAIEREAVLNEPSWSEYIPYELATRYRSPQTPEYAEIYPNVDWKKAMFKDVGISHRANLNIQAGTASVKYFGSLSYLHEGDMFREYDNHKGYKPNYNFDRFNFRNNIDFRVSRTTNLKVNLSGFYSQKNTNYSWRSTTSGGLNPDAWAAAYGMPPDVYLPQYSDGRWGWSFTVPVELLPNPVASLYNIGIRQTRSTELNADFALEQNLDFVTKGLSAKATLFYDNSIHSEGGIFDVADNIRPNQAGNNTPVKIINSELYTGPGQDPAEYTTNWPILGVGQFDYSQQPWYIDQEDVSSSVKRRILYQLQVNYTRKFNKHNFGALGLFKREEYALGSMFKTYREDWVFRATYDYDTRYLLEMNGAYNGSEKFGPGYRFAFFPSLGLGWNISNEKFFQLKWMNKLKFRFSTGMVGDDNVGGGRWLYDSQYAFGGTTRLNANPNQSSPYTWYRETVVGNKDIHWEKALKNNYGMEVGLFNNLVTASYDYFNEDRTDILLAGNSMVSIPSYFGATPPSANLGRVKSKGHELEVKYFKTVNNQFHYSASVALTHNENKILRKDDPPLLASYLKDAGYQIGQTSSQIRTGFYNNWDEVYGSVPTETNDQAKLPGFYNLLDFNADGVITSDDMAPIGYSQIPQNTYNFTLGADYKGLSIMVQFYGVNNVSRYVPLLNFNLNQDVVFAHVADYWSKDNPNATSYLPRWRTKGQNIGDYFIYDASYLRLKTAEIAYSFQDKWLKKARLSNLRLFLNGNNLIFWSKLPDDREGSSTGSYGDLGAYPTPIRVNLGIDLTF